MEKNSKGLTLIELLITIAVIAIVAAISVPVINNVINSSRAAADAAQAVIVIDFIEDWEQAGQLTQVSDSINAYLEGELIEQIEVPDGYLLSGTGAESDPYILIVNPPAVETETVTEPTGTFDDGEGTTYTRDATGITITTTSANWESMSVYYDSGGSQITNAVTKKMANGATSGILTKVSNTEVRIDTTTVNDFLFGIIYNGGSAGSFSFE
jgi:prepilin-type N-terminal cleavage/methylation domain-containing protein